MIRHADKRVDVSAQLADVARVTQAVRQAGRDARLRHKQLGVPIVVWEDGKIVEIPPEEIVVDPLGPPSDSASDR
jgi:hypothetical protein